jgi:hypothetical protein
MFERPNPGRGSHLFDDGGRLLDAAGAVQPGAVQCRRMGGHCEERGAEVHHDHQQASRWVCDVGTKQCRWNIVDATPYGKDPLQALASECRNQGVKLFFYHSHLDWTHP